MKAFWCFLSLITLTNGAEWAYTGDHGENSWSDGYPACGYSSQSPINIVIQDAEHDATLPAFTFSGYDALPEGASYTLKNNGHTAVVLLSANDSNAYSLSGGGLPTTYYADQFHFHWGSVDTQGSEHTVDSISYPMEVHIVHHSSVYDNISEAADKAFGLAVLGFFFKLGLHNDDFEETVEKLQNVQFSGETVSMDPFALFSMLPSDLTSYWRYNGSLTTPPCYESVVWTVFQKPIEISDEQLEAFRSLVFDERGNGTTPMVDIYRPVKPLGNRIVYSSVSTVDPNNDPNRFGLNSASSFEFTAFFVSLIFLFVLS